MIVKYLNPRNDVAFKRIFGTEKNKDILMHFLNDIIVSDSRGIIKQVTLINPTQQPEIASKKQSIVDVLCEDEYGVKYIVEMQVAKVAGFEKRAQYYAAKAYASQPDKGDDYKHLKEVIFLAITEYEMFPKKPDYKSVHVILDQQSHERDLKDFSFTFLELPKFTKDIHSLSTYQEKWCYFFKHAHQGEDMQSILANNNDIIQRAYHELEAHNWTNDELLAYESAEKTAKDARAREAYIKDEAREEGMKEGMEKGMEKGRQEGMEKGRHAEKLAIAKNMLSLGVDKKKVSEFTGLSLQEIEKLYDFSHR